MNRIKSGYDNLDEQIAGFKNGSLNVLVGEPSSGKTSFALSLSAQINQACGFFSIEIEKDKLHPQWQRYSHIHFNDTPNIPIDDLASSAQRMKEENGVKIILIDYLGLLQSNGNGNRKEQVSEIILRLKRLAAQLDIPIIVLSQLGRKNSDKPITERFRESELLAQEADLIMHLERYKHSLFITNWRDRKEMGWTEFIPGRAL